MLVAMFTTVQSKRKFTLASARHASALDVTRARIASRGTVTRLHIARKQSFTSSVARCDTGIPRVCSHYFIILAISLQFRRENIKYLSFPEYCYQIQRNFVNQCFVLG